MTVDEVQIASENPNQPELLSTVHMPHESQNGDEEFQNSFRSQQPTAANAQEPVTPTSRQGQWRTAKTTMIEHTQSLLRALRPASNGSGQGLGSSLLHPEELGSVDDAKLADVFNDSSNPDSQWSTYHSAMQEEAARMIRGIGGQGPRGSSSVDTLSSSLESREPSTERRTDNTEGDHDISAQPIARGVLSGLLHLHSQRTGRGTVSTDQSRTVPPSAHQPKRLSAVHPAIRHRPPFGPYKPQHSRARSADTSTTSLGHQSMCKDDGYLSSAVEDGVAEPPRVKRKKKPKKSPDEVKLTVHIADIMIRQRYLMQLCRAFMRYGAPTHRLEEYMQMTARVLDIQAQFMYLPGCMVMSFDDPVTRTGEVKLIRVPQGLDLGRLQEVHICYKRVTHDMVDINTAISEITELMDRPARYPKWLVILLYGFGSAAVGPFAFSARPIDMPIIFVLGCCVGFMQHVLAPGSALYSNVFEVTASILVSFLARAFGSIRLPGHTDPIFCYASITESSIALILPGFSVLTSSLELQSHQMIAGSIRLVYTILYSLFLGYGVTVGTTIYGAIDDNATSDTMCGNQDIWGSPYAQRFPFVALYCLIAALINQSALHQTPIMVLIGTSGYVTNYFSTQKLGSSSEVANTVGAFTIGLLANLYSRLWHGNAVASTIPGIFTLVPSGLASSGSIISAIQYSDSVKNGTADTSGASSGSSLTSLGFGMIQTAIGITVGLFIAALVVYPRGKQRSGLFSL